MWNNNKKIIHVWLATKYSDILGMKKAIDYMREFANFDLMENDLITEKKILRKISKNFIKRNLIQNNLNLNQQLDVFEAKLIAHSQYVRFNINNINTLNSNYFHG